MIQIFGRAHIDAGIENDIPFDYSLRVLESVLITLPSLRSQPWPHFNNVYASFRGGNMIDSEHIHVFSSYLRRYKEDILAFHTKLSKHLGDNLGVDPQGLDVFEEAEEEVVCALVYADGLGKNSKMKKKLTCRMDKEPEEIDGILDQALEASLSQPSPNYIQPGSFDELLAEQGNLKRLIYTNDRETIDYVRSLGVNFEAYMNLTDHSIVYQHIEILRNDPQLKGKNIYNSVATEMRAKLGILLKDASEEDVRIYADEIALYFNQAFSKGTVATKLKPLEKHIKSTMQSGNVSFQLASRDEDDLKLGDKCGDCTAKDGMNMDKPKAWVSDVNTQFLKMYYDGKFMGRLNLVLIESHHQPAILIDAIEFIPQAREVDKYKERAYACFKEGLEKVKTIAGLMGVKQVGAYTFSNSSGVNKAIEELGYEETSNYELRRIRKKDLSDVIDVEEDIQPYIQTRGEMELNRTQLRTFEHFMNNDYLKDPANRDELKSLIESEELDSAADIIHTYMIHNEDLFSSFLWANFDVARALQALYCDVPLDQMIGVELIKIV